MCPCHRRGEAPSSARTTGATSCYWPFREERSMSFEELVLLTHPHPHSLPTRGREAPDRRSRLCPTSLARTEQASPPLRGGNEGGGVWPRYPGQPLICALVRERSARSARSVQGCGSICDGPQALSPSLRPSSLRGEGRKIHILPISQRSTARSIVLVIDCLASK